MIFAELKNHFESVVGFDFEFTQDINNKGETPTPRCVVYKDFKSQKVFKLVGNDMRKIPFNPKKTLFVCYNAVAEASCLLALGIKLPKYWWDCYVENKKLYQGRIAAGKGAFGLVRTAKRYGLECISEDLKKWNIEQILSNNPDYTEQQLLDYCTQDVLNLEEVFYSQLKDIETTFRNKGPIEVIQHALFHGRSMAAVGQVEFNGIPIDEKLFSEITTNFPAVKEKMIAEINERIDVYENGSFSNKKFQILVSRLGLIDIWPRTPSGQLATTEKVIYNYAQQYDEINDLYFCKEFVDSQKLKGFIVGPDNRARCSLNMFGTKTGRTNQSTARYPFNTAKPMRNIIRPDENCAFIYADYKAQEVAIAAYLSQDNGLIAAYEYGDPYIYIAKLAKAVPDDATKDSHPKIRDQYKRTLLANFYGQGVKSLAAQLNIPIDAAVELDVKVKKLFPTYFEFINGVVNKAMIRGYMTTKFGWRLWVGTAEKINPRSMGNFPIQAHGSEMLRHALLALLDKDFEVNALVHDGILVHVPLRNLQDAKTRIQKTMEDASRIVLGGKVCNVDLKEIINNFEQEEEEQLKFNRIIKIIKQTEISAAG